MTPFLREIVLYYTRGGEHVDRRPNTARVMHVVWPKSEFSLSNLEYKILSKRSSMISRYLDSKPEASIT